MAHWRGMYSIHLDYDGDEPHICRWTMTRSWWAALKQGESGVLCKGVFNVPLGPGGIHDNAKRLLELAYPVIIARLADPTDEDRRTASL